MKEDPQDSPPSPLWVRLAVIAALLGLAAAYWFSVRVAPMTLEESQQALDARIAELSAYLKPSERLGTPEFLRQLSLDTGAAEQLSDLFRSDETSDEMEAVDLALLGPWDQRGEDSVDPEARAKALLHPPLRALLDAWVNGTVEPSEDEGGSVKFKSLYQYAWAALSDANYRNDSRETARWAFRIVGLIEVQLPRQSLESWAIGSLMLDITAHYLDSQPMHALTTTDREELRERFQGLRPLLSTPQQAFAMATTGNSRLLRDSLPTLEDDVERAKMVGFMGEVRPWENRVLTALAIESPVERERVLAELETEIESLSDAARMLASSADGLWGIYSAASTSLDEIIQHLEKP